MTDSRSPQPPEDAAKQLERVEKELQELRHRETEQLALNRQLRRLLDLCEHERKLFAHEIHDGLVQDLTGSLLFLDASLHRIDTSSRTGDTSRLEAVHSDLEKTALLLRRAIDEGRRLMSGLKPPLLQEDGLAAAIERLVDDMQKTYGMQIDLESGFPAKRLLPTIEIGLFRIIQESLHNVRRHSGTLQARVSVMVSGDTMVATISDEGRGFEPSEAQEQSGKRSGGYGLAGIRERVELAGGEVAVESGRGKGTTVIVRFPIVPTEE